MLLTEKHRTEITPRDPRLFCWTVVPVPNSLEESTGVKGRGLQLGICAGKCALRFWKNFRLATVRFCGGVLLAISVPGPRLQATEPAQKLLHAASDFTRHRPY